MKVWYCQTHFIADASEPLPAFCWLSLATRNPLPCEFGEMQLVPADALWQFNEAVSLLRECRGSVMEPVLVREIDEALPAMQSALEALVP